jgi:ABC-type microcin C transport system permease subunit YejE
MKFVSVMFAAYNARMSSPETLEKDVVIILIQNVKENKDGNYVNRLVFIPFHMICTSTCQIIVHFLKLGRHQQTVSICRNVPQSKLWINEHFLDNHIFLIDCLYIFLNVLVFESFYVTSRDTFEKKENVLFYS